MPASPRGGQAAACRGVFTFPTSREVMLAPPQTLGGSRGGPVIPASPKGDSKAAAIRRAHPPKRWGGQEETADVPTSPRGGQAAACRGVFTFPTTSSPRNSIPSAGRDINPHLQQRKQVQPNGGGNAATPLQDRRQTETEQDRPPLRPHGGPRRGAAPHQAAAQHRAFIQAVSGPRHISSDCTP